MSDRFFTFMIVPEKSDRVRKFTLPTLYLRLASFAGIALGIVVLIVLFDYVHVLSQVAENKRLRAENHILRSDILVAKGRLEALDQSVGRLKSFAHKLRVIGNLDSPQAGQLLQTPENLVPGGGGGGSGDQHDDGEDSGTIEDPENSKSSAPTQRKKGAKNEVPDAKLFEDPDSQVPLHTRLQAIPSGPLVTGDIDIAFEEASLGDQVTYVSENASKLTEIAEIEEQRFADLQEHFQDRVDRLLSTPSILPTRGYISSDFGHRYNPFSATRTFHAGMDIANTPGTPIYAPADGLVTFVGPLGGFGQVVRIDHGYNMVTKFGHNSRISVKKGQRIKRGEKIAEMGSSGRSTGPHLHYQVEVKGKPVNPRFFFFESQF